MIWSGIYRSINRDEEKKYFERYISSQFTRKRAIDTKAEKAFDKEESITRKIPRPEFQSLNIVRTTISICPLIHVDFSIFFEKLRFPPSQPRMSISLSDWFRRKRSNGVQFRSIIHPKSKFRLSIPFSLPYSPVESSSWRVKVSLSLSLSLSFYSRKTQNSENVEETGSPESIL